MARLKSTKKEILKAQQRVFTTEQEIRNLLNDGFHVHLILDVDGVLVSSRSDDVFELLGRDLRNYFEYEERLCMQPFEPGPWLSLVKKTFEWGVTQEIVTARSGRSALRFNLFLLTWIKQWDLVGQVFSIGHQSKFESYRIMVERVGEDPHTHIFLIDDSERNIAAFNEVVEQKEHMRSRLHAVHALPVRTYTKKELEAHVRAVLSPSELCEPFSLLDEATGESLIVVPEGFNWVQRGVSRMQKSVRHKAVQNGSK